MKRFILVRQGVKNDNKFPQVVICDTTELVPAVIDGYPTRVYKPVSEVLNYLEAYPKMAELNRIVGEVPFAQVVEFPFAEEVNILFAEEADIPFIV